MRYKDYLGLSRWTLNAITSFYKRELEGNHSRREESNRTLGAETEAVGPEAKEFQQPLEIDKMNKFSSLTSRGNVALLIPWLQSSDTDFRLLASRIVKE